jgi:phospholipid N-methyltransferase
MLVDSCDWAQAKYVVEFGPGTGVATRVIAQRLRPGTKFFAIERSHDLAQLAREHCPNLEIVEGCVTEVHQLCQQRDLPYVDAVISGLPWANFSAQLQQSILDAMFQVLRPGGQFATFAYLQGTYLPAGNRFRGLLDRSFSKVVKSPAVWLNFPPAFVYRCTR